MNLDSNDIGGLGAGVSVAGGQFAAAPDQRGRLFNYKADRGPVAYVLSVFVLRLGLFFFAPVLWCAIAVLPLVLLGMFIAPINHHHQHVSTFRNSILNRLYEIVLAVQAGVAPFAWVLHHNLGHHINYLNQPPHENPDESRWARPDGSQMGRFEYSIDLLLHHQIDIIRVGRKHPKQMRAFLLMKAPLWGVLGLMLWFAPLQTFLIFLLPAFLTLFHTIWATYEHHSGCPSNDHFDGSRNRENRAYNFLTGNLGLHTAHHKRPGLHWSLLPELHDSIRHQIPEDQIVREFW